MAVQGIPAQDPTVLATRPGVITAPRATPRPPADSAPSAPVESAPSRPAPRPGGEVPSTQRPAAEESEPVVTSEFRARLRVDEATQQVVAQILDKNDEVVRQIPPEELLEISQRFQQLRGLLFDERS